MKEIEHPIGTISHGTLRNQDLIPCFIETLNKLEVSLPADSLQCLDKLELHYPELGKNSPLNVINEEDPYWESEDASYDVEDLIDTLDGICKEGYYFGTHPGDGSDFGFWDVNSVHI